MERHRDLLTAGTIEGEVLDPADRRTRVAGESRRMQREVLGEVEKPHVRCDARTERCTLPIALRGSLSIVITRFGHL